MEQFQCNDTQFVSNITLKVVKFREFLCTGNVYFMAQQTAIQS